MVCTLVVFQWIINTHKHTAQFKRIHQIRFIFFQSIVWIYKFPEMKLNQVFILVSLCTPFSKKETSWNVILQTQTET